MVSFAFIDAPHIWYSGERNRGTALEHRLYWLEINAFNHAQSHLLLAHNRFFYWRAITAFIRALKRNRRNLTFIGMKCIQSHIMVAYIAYIIFI